MEFEDVCTAATRREVAGAAVLAADPVAGLYPVIEESARVLGVPCVPGRVLPVLSAYRDYLGEALVAFRVGTGRRHAGELDCRFGIPREADPYALAVSGGLTAPAAHPAGALLAGIARRCPVDSYGINFGVVGGFEKIWVVLPRDELQPVPALAAIASMPASLAANAGFFARHGMTGPAGIVGIGYRDKTVNLYLNEPAGWFDRQTIQSMLREAGLAAPSEQLLRIGERAFAVYVTLSWDSPAIKRICFAVATPDPAALPVRLDPVIERFVRHARCPAAGQKFVYYAASAPHGEYYKLQSYYRWRPAVLDLMKSPSTAAAIG